MACIIINVSRYLSSPQKMDRLHSFQHQTKLASLRIRRLKTKISDLIEAHGITQDEQTSSDLVTIMKEEEEQVFKTYAEGSFQQIFWNQQKEAASKSDKRGMRWHPLFIKWCLYLRHQSSKAYETLRESGCLQLPSQRTLRDYSNCIKAGAGFSADVDRQLMQAASLLTCPAWQKLVVILLDEMHIREDLVYNKHTGKMVGFCDLGEVNNLMLQFERLVEGNSDRRTPLANSMMVFMVRGLFSTLR